MNKNKETVRNRAHSAGSITEFLNKRKRQEEKIIQGSQEEAEVFKRKKVIQRTPPTDKTDTNQQENEPPASMENLEKMMMGMSAQLREIKEDTTSTKKEIKDIKEQMKSYWEELRTLKEDFLKKEVEWETERNEMRKEIGQMKRKLENQERNHKKNNIVVKGAKFESENQKQEITDFLQRELGVRADVEEVFKVGKQEPKVTVIKLKNFEQKTEILKQKYKLGSKRIYLDSDLTTEEQRVQAEIRKVARDEKNNGKNTRVGYRKIEINGVKYEWSEEDGGGLKPKN